jgi:3-dehydroquinate synthetase
MLIKYKIGKEEYRVTFCTDKEEPTIAKDLSRLYSDKKILLIIDKKVNSNIISNLIKDLKISTPNLEFLMVDGEKRNKNYKLLFSIINRLILKKFTKKSVIISCGGGVVGDVSALAASLYLRGLIYFHIPTTMTAIVDSCIGGKTGINYKNIINSVGNYYHPLNVYISKNIINHIPEREFLAGIPEIIKCGLINNKKILAMLINNKKSYIIRNFEFLSKIIKLTLETKIKFFRNDIYEKNKRLNLNFGHTFAHAIEMSLDNKREIIRHGEAVGIGLLCEIYYYSGKNKNFMITKKILHKYNLPVNIRKFTQIKYSKLIQNKIYNNIFLDKKKINQYPRYIKLLNTEKTKISELRDFKKIIDTIQNVIF